MKIQIARLSPHQNAKVFGVLSAIVSAVFLLPFALLGLAFMPSSGRGGSFPFFMFLFMPLVYLVLTYVMVAIGCWLYNALFRTIGGIEFEPRDADGRDALR